MFDPQTMVTRVLDTARAHEKLTTDAKQLAYLEALRLIVPRIVDAHANALNRLSEADSVPPVMQAICEGMALILLPTMKARDYAGMAKSVADLLTTILEKRRVQIDAALASGEMQPILEREDAR